MIAPAPTTIQDLPNELLYEILKWVQGRSNLDNVQNVCCLWHSLVDIWLGRAVTPSTQMALHPSNPELSKQGLELISEIGVKVLVIEANNGHLLENPPVPLPAFKRPYLLKMLVLRSTMGRDLFNSLLKGTVNLSRLYLTWTTLAQLREEDLKNLNFPRLTFLALQRSGPEEQSSPDNIRTLLRENHFRNLCVLEIDIPVETYQDLETMKVLIPFIGHHSLLTLFVQMDFPSELNPVDPSTYQEDFEYILNQLNKDEGCESLKSLLVDGWNLQGNYPHLEIWKEFILKQKSFQSLILKLGNLSNEFLREMCSRNASTLESLWLDQFHRNLAEIWVQRQIDCSAFSSLRALENLDLIGPSEIIGTQHLPPTLTHFSFIGAIPSEDMEHILLHLPNLDDVHLFTTRSDEGYRLRLNTLEEFIRNRKVSKARLNISQIECPEEGLSNLDPANPKMLRVRLQRLLNWELNEDGFYADVDLEDGRLVNAGIRFLEHELE